VKFSNYTKKGKISKHFTKKKNRKKSKKRKEKKGYIRRVIHISTSSHNKSSFNQFSDFIFVGDGIVNHKENGVLIVNFAAMKVLDAKKERENGK
jgi:hypothetical protein